MSASAQSAVLRSLQQAHGRVMDIPRYLLPSGGVALAYAIPTPRDKKDVAVARNTSVGFGVDEHLTRVLLTTTRFDADVRAAGIIRYTDETADMVRETLRLVATYDPGNFPPGISSMDWGIASCCRGGVPLAILDTGSPATEPLIRIMGTTPEEVANRILIISKRLTYTDI